MDDRLDTITVGDCLKIIPALPGSCIDLIIEDGPYHRVKNLDWDRQHKTVDEFLAWKGKVLKEYYRVLKPNGSLYVFAGPKMAARVEIKVSKYFNVLNHITWRKGKFDTKAEMNPKHWQRCFFPTSEIVIFAEHYGADNAAKGESGYGAKCDELRGFVFEPLRAYLHGEKERAGLTNAQISAGLGLKTHHGGIANHYLGRAQWMLPTAKHYAVMQALLNQQGRQPALSYEDYHDAPRSRFECDHSEGEYLRAEYEYLRAEYEDLRAEYEDLRRPFTVTAQDQYTDVWEFPTVKHYPGKHPCEKPLAMIEHMIQVSSKPGDLVADFFIGSGMTAVAALKLGRHFYGCDIGEVYVKSALERIEKARMTQLTLIEV